jgi:NAD(P)-dependent dehydrogenase (short-subunit alcohol dehydrogenase family)
VNPEPSSAGRPPPPAAPGQRLAGRTVLVVGGGRGNPDGPAGNGHAICVLAAREGAAVAVADIDPRAAAATVAAIEAEGGTAAAVIADVRLPGDCERLVTDARAALGGLDGLVLNVGIGKGLGLGGTDSQAWDEVLAVNLRSHFLVARAALPVMDGGAIVFIGSLAGLQPGTFSPSYDASKAGLVALCRHTAMEASRRGIRANLVAPGLIDTPMGRDASRARPARAAAVVPLGRQGTAWEVAWAVVFLLSGEASYITAQVLVVDGGLGILPRRDDLPG